MAVGLLDGLKAKLAWISARQSVLASNIANSNTPGFKPRDLDPFSLPGTDHISLATTDSGHFRTDSLAQNSRNSKIKTYETHPSGNAVVLEEEMTKLGEQQLDYQLASTLYVKSLGLLKIAVGRR
jgi:flagellar basal-body rod protein FlgB